jgi:RimJ/RimL family protein N-acetyltransferase
MRKQTRLTRPGDTLHLAIVRKSDGVLVGQVSIGWTDATAAQGEIRFVISPAYRRQGYATEAVDAAISLGFDKFHFHRIFARTAGSNQPSARLFKTLGMRLEAHYREHALFQGDWDEELHFAILDREWRRGTQVKEITRHKVA